jgi:hypothetical protein
VGKHPIYIHREYVLPKETKLDMTGSITDLSLGMVAFHMAFLALRSQDAGHPVEDIRDYELEGEREIYGG